MNELRQSEIATEIPQLEGIDMHTDKLGSTSMQLSYVLLQVLLVRIPASYIEV